MLQIKATQQINITGNLDRAATIVFVIEEAKETIKTSNKYGTEVTLNLVSNAVGDSNGEANF